MVVVVTSTDIQLRMLVNSETIPSDRGSQAYRQWCDGMQSSAQRVFTDHPESPYRTLQYCIKHLTVLLLALKNHPNSLPTPKVLFHLYQFKIYQVKITVCWYLAKFEFHLLTLTNSPFILQPRKCHAYCMTEQNSQVISSQVISSLWALCEILGSIVSTLLVRVVFPLLFDARLLWNCTYLEPQSWCCTIWLYFKQNKWTSLARF